MSICFEEGGILMLSLAVSIVVGAIIYANARFGLRSKQLDLIVHFNKQFDEIQKKRAEILSAEADSGERPVWSPDRIKIESEIFFDRFWSLQFDQFLAWYEGYVPTRLYVYWAFSRWRELHEPSSHWTLGERTMASTLIDLKRRWRQSTDSGSKMSRHVSKFTGFMFFLESQKNNIDLSEPISKFGPSKYRRFGRWLFGAE